MQVGRNLFLLTIALFIFAPRTARAAGGLNLSWSDCGAFGSLQRNFSCGGCTGSISVAFASAIPPADMPELNGVSAVLEVQTNSATLPQVWEFGGCRPASALTADVNFLSSVNCIDPWLGEGAASRIYTYPYSAPNRARIQATGAIPGTTLAVEASEYYLIKLTFRWPSNSPSNPCSGCPVGACIVLNSLQLTQPEGQPNYTITNPINRQYVQWQGGVSGGNCPGATRIRGPTWGVVKSLYR